MKTIIVYKWNSNSEQALIQTMRQMGIRVVEIDHEIKDYHADAQFAQELIGCLHREKADAVFSYDYFPIISSVCEINKVPYLSWIYDCPLYTLNSVTIKNICNYIFCFDGVYAERLAERGALQCVHLPLAVNGQDFEKVIAGASQSARNKYSCQVSFVGSLYNDERNRLRTAELDNYIRGYLEGIIAAQQQIYGYNFVEELLEDRLAEVLVKECRLQLGDMYVWRPEELAAHAVNMEITAREREEVLVAAADVAEVVLYTNSQLPANIKELAAITCRGYADNQTEMPLVFHGSKINLNITSRSIVSGIPLRILDILACGGFCLTNYQPEVAQFLEDGREIVMYTDLQDLKEKVTYYLENEEERLQIAKNGQRAVKERFSLQQRIAEMLELAGV